MPATATGCAGFLAVFCLASCSSSTLTKNRRSEAQRRGQTVYALWCAPCHDSSDLHLVKDPPGLGGIFLRETLPSGAPATDEQVRKTISEGRGIMPPFQQNLNADEIDDLVAFLHSLKRHSDNADAMRAHWKHLGNVFIQIVATMPQDKYNFRPTKKSSSFRELVMHAVEDNYINMGYVAGKSWEESEKLAEKYKNITTRSEILDALEDSYDFGDMVLSDLDNHNATDTVTTRHGERTTRAGAVLQAFDDPMDYYGNLVVYLGLNGIAPPDTEEDEEDMALPPPSRRPLNPQRPVKDLPADSAPPPLLAK